MRAAGKEALAARPLWSPLFSFGYSLNGHGIIALAMYISSIAARS